MAPGATGNYGWPDGTSQRQYVLTVGNVGQLPCTGTLLLGSLTP
ncbi:hypothetical protein [Micromonospora sp. NBC_00421]